MGDEFAALFIRLSKQWCYCDWSFAACSVMLMVVILKTVLLVMPPIVLYRVRPSYGGVVAERLHGVYEGRCNANIHAKVSCHHAVPTHLRSRLLFITRP